MKAWVPWIFVPSPPAEQVALHQRAMGGGNNNDATALLKTAADSGDWVGPTATRCILTYFDITESGRNMHRIFYHVILEDISSSRAMA